MPEASNVSRRNLLAMLPAAAVAVAVPTHGLAEEGEGSGEIMRLFGRFCELMRAAEEYNQATHRLVSDEEMERLFYLEIDALEDRIKSMPSASASDFAVKFLIATDFGNVDPLDEDPIWEEAAALTGRQFP